MNENSNFIKQELVKLSRSIESFIEDHKQKLTKKEQLIHELKDIGFINISKTAWAFDLNINGKSYVSFMISINKNGASLTEDHVIIVNGKEVPASTYEKPFFMQNINFSKVSDKLFKRIQELILFYNGGKHVQN